MIHKKAPPTTLIARKAALKARPEPTSGVCVEATVISNGLATTTTAVTRYIRVDAAERPMDHDRQNSHAT